MCFKHENMLKCLLTYVCRRGLQGEAEDNPRGQLDRAAEARAQGQLRGGRVLPRGSARLRAQGAQGTGK